MLRKGWIQVVRKGWTQVLRKGWTQVLRKGWTRVLRKGWTQVLRKGWTQVLRKGWTQVLRKGWTRGLRKGWTRVLRKGFEFKVFNATFNNISVISWWSVLLLEDPEKTTDLLEVAEKLYHIMLCQVHLTMNRVRTTIRRRPRSGKISNSCFTSDTRCVSLITN